MVDTRVKERMVGAVVLVAAAMILIPELLSGPHRTETASGAQQDETALHSFSIDLSKRGADAGAAANVPPPAAVVKPPDNVLPPPELPEADAGISPAGASASASQAASGSEPAKEAPKEEAKEAPPRDESSVQTPQAESPPADEKSSAKKADRVANAKQSTAASTVPSATRGWAVQVGSFGDESVAQRIARGFKEKGYAAFVMPFKTGAKTLYRVRIGPQSQRTAAEAVAAKLKAEGTPSSVVSHP